MLTTTPTTDPLEHLAREHAAPVFRYLRSLVGDAEAARDLVQETFLRLGRHASRTPEAGAIGAGLVFATARSCGLDHLRRRRVRWRHEAALADDARDGLADLADLADPAAVLPDRALEDAQFRRALLVALGGLPEDQRTVFHLSEVEGLTYDAIARLLDISPGTVASRKHHAVRKLRDGLRRLGHDT